MIYGISMYSKNTNYQIIVDTLKEFELDEITFINHPDLVRYAKEENIPTQPFKIDWNTIVGVDPSNIVQGKYKPYNRAAPKEAAEKVVHYADKIIIIGEGDGNINALAKTLNKEIVNKAAVNPKQYKF